MEIILLRHGKPEMPPSNKMYASDFLKWVSAYNLSGLCESSVPTKDAILMANKCDAVVSSNLPRSFDSPRH